mgnify:CR=1 FL=1
METPVCIIFLRQKLVSVDKLEDEVGDEGDVGLNARWVQMYEQHRSGVKFKDALGSCSKGFKAFGNNLGTVVDNSHDERRRRTSWG